MQIEYKKIGDIIPYENNPRYNDEAVEYVANSIKEFGFKVPIVVDKDNIIVTGHTRYKAAKLLGMEEIPVIKADDLNEQQIKTFRVVDNKVSEKSYWDLDKLGEEVENLNIDMTDFGFDEFELAMLKPQRDVSKYDNYEEGQYDGSNYINQNEVVITYKPYDEYFIKKLLGVNKIKTVYSCKELIENTCGLDTQRGI